MELFNKDFGIDKNINSDASLNYYSKKAGLSNGEGYTIYSGITTTTQETSFGIYVGTRSYDVITIVL